MFGFNAQPVQYRWLGVVYSSALVLSYLTCLAFESSFLKPPFATVLRISTANDLFIYHPHKPADVA